VPGTTKMESDEQAHAAVRARGLAPKTVVRPHEHEGDR